MATPMISENWPKLLEPGLRWIFEQRLTRRESLGKRQEVYNVLDSKKAKEFAMGVGAFSDEDWNFEQTHRVNYGNVKPGFEYEWEHREFAKGMLIERKLLDDNLYPGSTLPRDITKKPAQFADSAYILREKAAAEVFNYATTGSGVSPLGFTLVGGDGVALASNSHPLHPGSSDVQDNYFAGLDLTDDNYSYVRQRMRKTTDDNGNIVQVSPTTLMVPPELEDQALTIIKSQGKPGTADNDANVVGSRIKKLVVWDYLTDTNRWFVMDEMLKEEHLIWFERIPLEFAATQDWDTFQGKYRAYMRYSRGFSDWRWIAVAEAS